MWLSKLAKSEWQDIKNDLKYDLYKYGFVLVGGSVVALGTWLVHKISGLPPWVPWAVAFVLTVLVFILLNRRLRKAQQSAPSSVQVATNALVTAAPKKFDATEYFRRAYLSPLQAECEQNFRIAANENQPDDHEGFYVRFMAVGLIAYLYDIAWAYIYKSQILLLMELNRRTMALTEARTYYDRAAKENPTTYANYSFDQWLRYLETQVLAIRHPNDTVEITLRGQDFLRYLTHWGRYADDRAF